MEFWIFVGVVVFIWWRLRARKKRRPANAFKVQNGQIGEAVFQPETELNSVGRSRSTRLFTIETRINTGSRSQNRYKSPARWIAQGETIKIAGLPIEGGLIYVGENLSTQNGYQTENCLINPKLNVSRSRSDDQNSLPYWPAYQRISPSQRMKYLRWLAGDRNDPRINIGYVFLYFYGLERRLFLDETDSEMDVLVGEVEHLLSVYGSNRSFQTYADTFLSAAAFLKGELPPSPVLTSQRNNFELPPMLRAAIGLKLRDGEKLSWDWLLAWFLSHPETYLRTPATRCFDEFKFLFKTRFNTRYPDGLAVRKPKKVLSPNYRAASGTFTVELENRHGSIPDPADLKVPVKIAGEIAEQVTNDLDAYSRYLGRNPDTEGTLAAQLLLPRELPHAAGSVLGQFRAFLDERMAGATTRVRLQDLLETLQFDDERDKPSMSTLKTLSNALAACDVGMEPDRAFGAQAIGRDMDVVLFRAEGGGGIDAGRQSFAAARFLVELAALAITADGIVDDKEIAVVIKDIRQHKDLSAMERARLLALLSSLIHAPQQQQSLLRRLAKANEHVRDGAAQLALGVIAADGRLETDEIRFAEKLYKTLKLPSERLYADLNGLGASLDRDEPVTVAKAEHAKGHPIPKPPRAAGRSGDIILDPALVIAKRRETAKVSALLANVFAEEDAIDVQITQAASEETEKRQYDGLDATHSMLVDALIENNEMAEEEFAALCRKAGLFAAGAIETINDWAFEALDDALIEDGDPVAIDPDLLEPLKEIASEQRGTAQ